MAISFPQNLIPTDPRFGCGPSLIQLDDLIKLKEKGPHLLGTSHRKAPVRALCRDIQQGLRDYLSVPDDYSVVLGNGGATVLFDMVGLGLVKKRIIHHICGEFSTKWFKASRRIPWIESDAVTVDYGQGNSHFETQGADVVACTLNETSTGVMNIRLPEVGEQCLLAVDATSGAGQIPCDLSTVDVFFFSPQKVFASEGGLFVAILSPKAKARIEAIAATDRYIPAFGDWQLALKNSEQQQTYNTPAVVTLFLFAEQLKRMNKIGFAEVERQAAAKAAWLYQWAESRPYLSAYVAEPAARSTTVATIDVADRIPVGRLTHYLDEQGLVHGIEGYRALGRNQLRIAMFHNIALNDLKKLTGLIDFLVETGEFTV